MLRGKEGEGECVRHVSLGGEEQSIIKYHKRRPMLSRVMDEGRGKEVKGGEETFSRQMRAGRRGTKHR